MAKPDPEVLIAGAGPTGLALALWLRRLGVDVRIIDQGDGPGGVSRAFAIQSRTLEYCDQLGVAQSALARGHKVEVINVHMPNGRTLCAPFGDFGGDISPFPFVLVLLQNQYEKLLIERLDEAGVKVEWNTALVDLSQEASGVSVSLLGGDGARAEAHAAYLCGCDGAGSVTRQLLDTRFEGLDEAELFYVADVRASGAMADGGLHYVQSQDGLLSLFPLSGGAGRVRLIGLAPPEVRRGVFQVSFSDLEAAVSRDTGLRVELVEDFATFAVRRRIAERFSIGRVFLLGEAAHVHSPAGGQGLNAGAGDAANLAWKLAAVLKGEAAPALLDSYDAERRRTAQRIMATTDVGFRVQTGRGLPHRLSRAALAAFSPALMRVKPFRGWVFRTLSQIALTYRGGPLSEGRVKGLAGGDRLPWVGGTDNHAALGAPGWQVQVHGEIRDALAAYCARAGLTLRRFAWSEAARRAGLTRDAVYLVRPDGYIGLACAVQQPERIEAYLARVLGRPPAA